MALKNPAINIDLTDEQKKTLLALLEQYLPGIEVWAYGSRARWNARPNSDLDLVAFADDKDLPAINALKEAFDESNLPFRVDLHVWNNIPENFHENIRKEKVVVQTQKPTDREDDDFAPITIPFDELISFVIDNRGRTCPTSTSGIPLIATNCVSNDRLYPTYDSVRYVDNQTYSNWFRAHPKPGDILFVLKGSPGRCALAPDPVDFCIAQDMVAVRANKEKIDSRYLFAALRSPTIQDEIDRMHVGTMIPHFRKGDFNKLFIPVPDRATQESIGFFYLTFEKKIELNRRMNETLEAMARTVFQDWFVDFGPTKAKMAGQAPYLAPEIWSLFPDHLDDEGKPKSWETKPLSSYFTIVSGGTPATGRSDFWGGTIPWFSVVDTPKNGVFVCQTEKYITETGLKNCAANLVREGTTIISARGTVGNLAMAAQDMTFNQSCYGLLAHHQYDDFFVFLLAQHAVELLKSMSHGSVFSTITRQTFDAIYFEHGGLTLREKFSDYVRGSFARMKNNALEAVTLAATRDYLLPKLMSGEIRVRDAEKMVA